MFALSKSLITKNPLANMYQTVIERQPRSLEVAISLGIFH